MSSFVVVHIGCLECSNESDLLGHYATAEDAKAAHPDAKLRTEITHVLDWHGDSMDVIFPLPPIEQTPARSLAEHDHLGDN